MKRPLAQAVLPATILLTSCGYVSAPLPPALDIPVRVSDLRATETGENIEAAFTLPPLTTDGLALQTVKSVELRVVTAGNAPAVFEVPAKGPGPLERIIPAGEWIGQDVALAVRATGPKGRMSDWSNEVRLRVEAPLTRPSGFTAENVARGVRLTWQGNSARYRIYRATGDQKQERLAESDAPEYLDESTQYGMTYQYSVRAIAGESQQSEVSDTISITPKDEFPPTVPVSLTAVPDVSSIELAWERNTESDFQGYNVYRSAEGGPFDKIATLIQAPAYSDRQVESGKKYRYTVSAVDLSGNESARSAMLEVTAQ